MSRTTPFHDVRNAEQRNLALGLSLALILHLGLTLLPSFRPIVSSVMPTLRISLQAPSPNETVQQEEQIEVEPVSEASMPQRQSQPQNRTDNTVEPEQDSIEPITSAMISDFTEQEADQTLKFDQNKLASFKATFSDVVPSSSPTLQNFQNAYGETHVITKLGDRTVCYQRNSQFVDDDWGFNIVMFYACEQEEKLKLEMP